MTYQQIDFIFPFVVFAYGFIMTMTLNSKMLMELAEKNCPPQLLFQFKTHRWLGVVSLILGGLWAVQNVWYYA